jgi:ABC-type dipeptide/oligopeptide/nickel transport system permease component
MPVFVIGELLILVVFLPLNEHGFHWIQTGYCGPSQGLGAWFGHMILPWITLAPVQAAVYSRLSRGQLLHARRGLHPNRPGQGPVRAAGDLQAGVRRGGR